jgi:hypothetical protein
LNSFQVLPVQYPVGEEKEDAKRLAMMYNVSGSLMENRPFMVYLEEM